MSKTNPNQTNITLGVGDLIINIRSKTVGVLLEKHRLLKTIGTASSSEGFNREATSWDWVWSIKWSNKTEKDVKKFSKWVKSYASTEQSLIEDIKKGEIEHYSVKE